MAIFNSYVKLPEGSHWDFFPCQCQGRRLSAGTPRCFCIYPRSQGASKTFLVKQGRSKGNLLQLLDRWRYDEENQICHMMSYVVHARLVKLLEMFVCLSHIRFMKHEEFRFFSSANCAGLLWRVLPREIHGRCQHGLPATGTTDRWTAFQRSASCEFLVGCHFDPFWMGGVPWGTMGYHDQIFGPIMTYQCWW